MHRPSIKRDAGLFRLAGIDILAGGGTACSALSENGTVTMPLEKTFWAERFGMLVDQFGTP